VQDPVLPERVDWFRVSQELNRPPRACREKHLAMEKCAAQKKVGQETVNMVIKMAAVKEEKNGGGEMSEEGAVGEGEDEGGVSGDEGEGEDKGEGEGESDREQDNGIEGKGVGKGVDDDQMTEELNDEAESAVVDLTA